MYRNLSKRVEVVTPVFAVAAESGEQAIGTHQKLMNLARSRAAG